MARQAREAHSRALQEAQAQHKESLRAARDEFKRATEQVHPLVSCLDCSFSALYFAVLSQVRSQVEGRSEEEVAQAARARVGMEQDHARALDAERAAAEADTAEVKAALP
jgi:hypothetical protein